MVFVDAITAWQGISAKVDMGLHRRITWLANNDRCCTDSSYDTLTLGQTRYYTRVNNVVKLLPDDQIPTETADWYFATETLYPGNIRNAIGNDDDTEEEYARNIAIHELGHSLKMAHPSYYDAMIGEVRGQGTDIANSIHMIGGSIMEKYPSVTYIKTAPLQADKDQLRKKWDNPN